RTTCHFTHCCSFFLYVLGRPRRSTLFPYTTLFRSEARPLERSMTLMRFLAARHGPPMGTQRLPCNRRSGGGRVLRAAALILPPRDRKSTRLNSSHVAISYAVFCLKKKKKSTHGRLI